MHVAKKAIFLKTFLTLCLGGLSGWGLKTYLEPTCEHPQDTQGLHPGFDISKAAFKPGQIKQIKPVWLISYAAHGAFRQQSPKPPSQKSEKKQTGNTTAFQNQHFLHFSGLNKGIQGHRLYSPNDLDRLFKEKNKTILSQPRGAGYWLWKPYIILHALAHLPKDHMLIYADGGVAIRRDLSPLLLKASQYDITLFDNYHTNERYIKRDAYHLTGAPEAWRFQKQLSASVIIIKNGPKARAFIQKWLALMTDPDLTTDRPSYLTKEHANFVEHRHDQAVLTLLACAASAPNLVRENLGRGIPFLCAPPIKLLRLPWHEGLGAQLKGRTNIFRHYFWHHRRRQSSSSLFSAKELLGLKAP